jgi:hypothetical protein
MTTANVSTTLTNVTYSTLTLTGVSVTAGQRIAIELGGNFTSGANVATTAAVNIADNSVTDLPVDNTTTTANNCWFEFSQAIKFYPMTGMM